MTLPLAHIGHYLWVFYILPVIFVVIGILRTTLLQKREARGDDPPAGGTEGDPRTDEPARPQDPPL
jgi:hypothetical protein